MINKNDLTNEEFNELKELLEQLKQIEKLAEKSKKEKVLSEIVAVLVFILTASVMLYINSGIIDYSIWVTLICTPTVFML